MGPVEAENTFLLLNLSQDEGRKHTMHPSDEHIYILYTFPHNIMPHTRPPSKPIPTHHILIPYSKGLMTSFHLLNLFG